MRVAQLLGAAIIITVVVACTAETVSPTRPNVDSNTTTSATQIVVDDSRTTPTYANFCRVTGSPEELTIDFGFNPNPVGEPTTPIVIGQRVVMNFYTAKRLTAALQMSIERHEQAFGRIETDIEKRMRE